MREIEGHFHLEKFLFFSRALFSRRLVPLIEGETDDDCLDDGPLFVNFLVVLSRLVGLQLNIPKQPILGDDNIQVVLLDT